MLSLIKYASREIKSRWFHLTAVSNRNFMIFHTFDCVEFKHIWLQNCFIPELELITLTLIDVTGYNPWKNFDYGLAPNLHELTIVGFHLGDVMSTESGKNFSQLRRLILRKNRIQSFDFKIFDKMPKLMELDLEMNNLRSFQHQFGPTMKIIYLDGLCFLVMNLKLLPFTQRFFSHR